LFDETDQTEPSELSETSTLSEDYDVVTLGRIEAAGSRRSPRPRPSATRRATAVGSVVAAALIGIRDALEAPRRSEIEMVDPWTGGGGNALIALHWDPEPRRTVAEVRRT
jgi:hypothetical protein